MVRPSLVRRGVPGVRSAHDSTATHAAAPALAARPDSAAHAVVAAPDSNAAAKPMAVTAAAAAAPSIALAHPIPDSLTTPTYRPVARLLMNMKPADAGKVLSYLNDTQVEGILRALGARQAAVLLSQMPAERAAQLSRRLMLPAGGGT